MPENGKGNELLVHGLKDMYDAEQRFAEALTTMAGQVRDRTLADDFRRHCEVTREHITRLEQCLWKLGQRPQRETCEGAKGLVEEYRSFVQRQRPAGNELDVFAAAVALKIEHYEIASYATMIDLALRLDANECAGLLEENIRDEEAAAAELELSEHRLAAELTGSSAGLRGAVETLRVGSRSGGIGAVGRAVRHQAAGAVKRLEERGRRTRTTTAKKRTAAKRTTAKRTTAKRTTAKRTTAKRGTASRSRSTKARTTAGTRAKTARKTTTTGSRAGTRRTTTGRRRPTGRAKATRSTRRTTSARPTSRRATTRPAGRRTTSRANGRRGVATRRRARSTR